MTTAALRHLIATALWLFSPVACREKVADRALTQLLSDASQRGVQTN